MQFLKILRDRLLPETSPPAQILSDLHLEVGQQYSSYAFPATAPYLILAGDIGRLIDYEGYLQFLTSQVHRYTRILLILGNHEFYELEYEQGIEEARRLVAEPALESKVTLLHRERWDDPESSLTVLGCTLWSALPPESRETVALMVSDFKKINGWTTEKHHQIHEEEVAWPRGQLRSLEVGAKHNPRRILVATHHAPCVNGTSRPEQAANSWSPAFVTELLASNDWSGVKAWVFGHTHYSADFTHKGIRVFANQRGYILPKSYDAQREETERHEGWPKKKLKDHEFDASKCISV